jgi:hypothetical protein
VDYTRLNQFPEWFTVKKDKKYLIQIEGKDDIEIEGRALQQGLRWNYLPIICSYKSKRIIIRQ